MQISWHESLRVHMQISWHESAPNLADIGAKLVVGTSDHRDAVKVTWQKQRAEPSW